jgi:hypothetical protein
MICKSQSEYRKTPRQRKNVLLLYRFYNLRELIDSPVYIYETASLLRADVH